jgi:hypothetical protein
MKSDVSNAESQFAVLCSQLNSFGISVITQYENVITQLQTQVKTQEEELKKLRPTPKKEDKPKQEKNQGVKK